MAAPKKTPAKPKTPRKRTSSTERRVSPEAEKNEAAREIVEKSSRPTPARKPFTYKDVYFFIPNLTGYARVLLTIAGITMLVRSHQKATGEWKMGLFLYVLSFILDFFDGYFARMFQQQSNFGAVLDMVTDRVSTMLLLVVLCQFYPEHFGYYAFLAGLDYSSHWVQMYAAKGHHKSTNSDKNIIVRTFYGVYPFFGFCCVGTEIFYVAMAALRFEPNNEYINFLRVPLLIACISKNIVNVAQLMSGFEAIAKRDAAGEN